MQEKHLYEYATIRVMPKVEREEFINVGVIIFCKKSKFLKIALHLNIERLQAFCSDVDIEQLERNLEALRKIVAGEKSGGPIAHFDIPSRFRWLTAVRSSVIQTSRPHPGLCTDLEITLNNLFEDLVL